MSLAQDAFDPKRMQAFKMLATVVLRGMLLRHATIRDELLDADWHRFLYTKNAMQLCSRSDLQGQDCPVCHKHSLPQQTSYAESNMVACSECGAYVNVKDTSIRHIFLSYVVPGASKIMPPHLNLNGSVVISLCLSQFEGSIDSKHQIPTPSMLVPLILTGTPQKPILKLQSSPRRNWFTSAFLHSLLGYSY